MKIIRRSIAFLCLGLFIISGLLSSTVGAGNALVYVVPLDGEVDGALPLSMKLAFDSASRAGADAIILEIDTFGGRVDSADKIKNHIYDAPVPIYAYVKTAISAGAYIALAADGIYMHPGSTMGAVEPVIMGSEEGPDEKTFSVVDNAMRSMAQRQGRDPDIATAMVRRDMEIPGVIERGRLLTLTANQAEEVGYAEGIANGYDEILEQIGLSGARIVHYAETWSVRFARFLTSYEVASILLAVGMAAIFIEIFTAGFGVAGTIALTSFALFFGGHLLVGFAGWETIALFIVGIILLLAEVFIAGFGILGAGGLIFIAFSIVLSAETLSGGLFMLGISLLLAVVIIIVAFRFLRKSAVWTRLILSDSESKDRGYVGPKDLKGLVGVTGVTITPLRPSGSVKLADGQRVDAITEGGYLPIDTEVIVTGYSSGDVVVTPIDKKS